MRYNSRHQWRSSYFRRLFLSYFMISLSICCMFGYILFKQAKQTATEQFLRDAQTKLSQVQAFMEETIPDYYKRSMFGNVLSKTDPAAAFDNVQKIFYSQYEPNIYQIFNTVSNLKSTLQANPGTDAISIYFRNTTFVVDSYTFFKLTENYPDYKLISGLDHQVITANHWLARTKYYDTEVAELLFTYAYAFPEKEPDDKKQGYMLIDLSIDGMQSLLDSQLRSADEKMLLYNRTNNIAIGSSNLSEQEKRDFTLLLSGKADEKQLVDADVYFSILADQNPSTEWVFALIHPYIVPSPWSHAVKSVWIISIGVVLLCVALSYYLAMNTYKPVRYLLHKLRNVNKSWYKDTQHNEFMELDRMLAGLIHKMDELTGKVNEGKWISVLNGYLDDDIYELFPEEAQVVIVKLIVYGYNKEVDTESVRSLLNNTKLSYPSKIIEINKEEYCIIYYVTDQQFDAMKKNMEEDLAHIQSSCKSEISFIAGVGNRTNTIEGISISYEQAATALKYFYIYETKTIIHYDEISGRNELPTIHFDSFQNALRAGDIQLVRHFISEFAKVMRQSEIAIESIDLSTMQLMMVLSKVMIDMNTKESIFPSPLSIHNVKQHTFSATIQQVQQQSEKIASHIRHYLHSRNQLDVVLKLKDYIDHHLHEAISLDMLSEMTGLSTQYLSKQFKEIVQVSFIDYLTNARMERACELLQNTNLSVTKIAEKTGYNNLQYFSSRFKQRYGVTPMQYRNSVMQSSRLSANPVIPEER